MSGERCDGLCDGFDAYRTPTDADYCDLLTQGLVVLDANVFLDLYRHNERTRGDLFAVLQSLGDRSRWVVPGAVVLVMVPRWAFTGTGSLSER